jgi:hypothetical protein
VRADERAVSVDLRPPAPRRRHGRAGSGGWYRPCRLVSDTTLVTPRVSTSGDDQPPQSGPGTQSFLRRHIWWLVGVGVIIVSAAIVRWVNTRPGYDPYGWLIWGYQTLHLHLDLGGAPSWKPLPLLFTVPYALFGHYALWLWMVTAEAAAFAGSIFAGRIAYRVVNSGGDGSRRYLYAAIAAAIFAGAGMYGIQDNINGAHSNYLHYVLSVQSDPMIVTLVLAAIDFHINGHRRWVIAMLLLAGLGRPEVWPVLGLYGLWCWVKRPDMRIYLGVCAFLLVFLWFGIPTITNGRPLVAGDLAQGSPRECRSGKILCTIDRFKTLNLWPVWVFTLAAVAWAGYRLRATGLRLRGARTAPSDDTVGPAERAERDNYLLVLGLGAAIVVWLVVEVAFALHGWPAVPRYIFEPAVVAIVLGAIGFGWVLREIPTRLRVPAWSGVAVGAVLVLALVPGALSRIRVEHKDVSHDRARTVQISRLTAMVSRLGGRQAVLRCGKPVTNVEFVSILAWLVHRNVGVLGHRPNFELHLNHPVVLFTQLPNGWASYPWHTYASKVASCQRMKAVYVVTRGHPGGVMVRNRIAPKPVPPIANTPLPG